MSEGKGRFRSLSPGNDAINVDNYVEFLHTVTTQNSTNTDFGNIALTGDIGIGKSSIVRTYEKKYNYKFVYITAGDLGYRFEKDEITNLPILPRGESECSADEKAEGNPTEAETNQEQEEKAEENPTEAGNNQKQEENKKDKPNDTADDEREKLVEKIQQKLEKNLLEQLIALCKNKDIPKSRFQTVPENESTADKKFWQIFYPIFCVIAAFCGFKLIANNFIEQDFLDFVDFVPIMWLILIVFFSLSIGVAVSKLITHYKFTKLSLNVGKEDTGSALAEIDIDEGENASLDTNLHEIIYLFEQLAKKKKRLFKWRKPVFVIEDVDRYPAEICFPILTKFKQINDMLNNRYRLNHSGYGKHFKFIYTLNDKIFDDSQGNRCVSDNDPYKFFDVIIPVIPKLSFANSISILKNDFKDYNIDEEFLKDVSFYIYDFRKLRDIQNEFEVYYDKFKDELNKTQTNSAESTEAKKNVLTPTVLLAFVMYKIFYKGEYYKLFRTNKQGAPISSLMKKYLGMLGDEKRDIDTLEDILEDYFEKYIDVILELDDDVKNKYRGAVVADDKDIDLNKVDMRNLDFSGQNLSGRNFSYMNLTGANFRGANLENAELDGANLINAKLNNASLYNASIVGANLERAELKNTILVGAILVSANLKNTNLDHAKLEGANFNSTNLKGSNIKNTSYYNVTTWTKATYDFDTEFPEDFNPKKYSMILDLKNEHLERSNFKRKDLSFALLQRANLQQSNLQQSNLQGANLEYAILQDAKLQEAKLQYANLQNSNLKSANLKNILYKNTKWKNARYNLKTHFPKNFKPKHQGMILDLSWEDLKNMDLSGKDLNGAWLYGTNLENVVHDNATIWTNAKYCLDEKCQTIFPNGFDPEEHYMIEVDIDGNPVK